MSLHQAAKHIASKGRGEDTVLIHMTPKEVKSLQELALANGGSLSINPETGLPEAGFLSKILPAVVGAGLMVATGGAAAPAVLGMSMPTAIGVGIGGLETLRTGSLGKGLMAGLGAYGGAGLAGGLMASGAQQMAGQEIAKEAAENAALEGMTLPSDYASMAAQTSTPGQQALARMGTSNLDLAGKGLTGGYDMLQSGMTAAGGPSLMRAGLAAASPVISSALTPQGLPALPQGSGPNPYKYEYDPGVSNPFPKPDVPEYGNLGQDFGRQQRYYSGAKFVPMTQQSLERMAGGGIADAFAPGQPVMYAAKGGRTYDLGDYSDGGRLLRGPGDGVSDSIPATIGGKQPARLADGEFVVPARIVSELGNGSTEAGARKLYAMMDRVQKARGKTVGKGKVAKNTRADKHLPA